MKHSLLLSLYLAGGTILFASTLSVYTDKTIYTYNAKSTYVGISQGISANCKGKSVPLHTALLCPRGERLCKELLAIEESRQQLNKLNANSRILDKLISLPQPQEFDAESWIKSARLLSEEEARLKEETEKTSKILALKKSAFQKQAPSENILMSEKICTNDFSVTIPYSYVRFRTSYEAELINTNEIEVTQLLSVTNRSGIEIEAKEAAIYFRPSKQYVPVLHFRPWLVREWVKPVYLKRNMLQKTTVASNDMAMSMQAESTMPAPVARYEDAREYTVENLFLPSNGVPQNFELLKWRAAVNCMLKAYPYAQSKAFDVCIFEPKFQIESNTWKIKAEKNIVNNHAVGEYQGKKYAIYTKVDEDIKIVRKPMVKDQRETGIFGTTVRKKDGFVLEVTNKSKKPKALTIVERIPASETKKIAVKLLSVSAKQKIEYSQNREGKLDMKVKLAPKERLTIKVLFELSYDKDLQVNY